MQIREIAKSFSFFNFVLDFLQKLITCNSTRKKRESFKEKRKITIWERGKFIKSFISGKKSTYLTGIRTKNLYLYQ